jgi:DNA polymerase III subunit epsilon
MREIILDTETTGLNPANGDRIVEIAGVELLNCVPTGATFHRFINPERAIPAEAFAVHGLSDEFLARHPPFREIAEEFLIFIGTDRLVIHNAEFDLGFINAELRRLDKPVLTSPVEDTLLLARRRFPGAPASLDALCRRFAIDLSRRDKHNALLDCELLAGVYLELIGGRQPGFEFSAAAALRAAARRAERIRRPPRPHTPSPEERAAHALFLQTLKEPLWRAE